VTHSPLDREPDGVVPPQDAAQPGVAGPGGDARPAPRPRLIAARSTLRRAPRFRRFAGAGIVLGAVLAALAAILGPPGTTLGRGAIFLLVFLALGSLGALIGSLLAVVADRRSIARR
jgi:hypothetical protein